MTEDTTDVTTFNDKSTRQQDLGLRGSENPDVVLFVKILITVSCGFVTMANIIILLAVYFNRKLRTKTNHLVISLAVVDLIVGISSGIVEGVDFLSDDLNERYFDAKTSVKFFSDAATHCSLFHLLIIGGDRFVAVWTPLRYAAIITVKVTITAIGCVWAISLAIATTFVVTFSYRLGDITAGIYLTTYFGTLLMLIIMYGHMGFTALVHRRKIAEQNATAAKNSTSKDHSISSRKTTRMLTVVIGAFALLWAPRMVMGMFKLCGSLKLTGLYISMCANLFAILNSGINIVIYFFMNRKFRFAFISICRCNAQQPKDTAESLELD